MKARALRLHDYTGIDGIRLDEIEVVKPGPNEVRIAVNEGYGVDVEFAIVPSDFVSRYPPNLSPEQACCIWVAYLTAYYALVEIADVGSDDCVLITAGSSGAGLAAMETCRMYGAKTIATSRQYYLKLK